MIFVLFKKKKKQEEDFEVDAYETEDIDDEETDEDEEKEKTLIYSVINSEAKRELIPLIRKIDSHAFINIIKTEELDGRFHDIPHD